jgi:predicted AAA+ superfamily ATPase
MASATISDLQYLDSTAREEGGRYALRRDLYAEILGEQGRHFIGIVGPRGAGKTVLLKQLTNAIPGGFYVSADTLGDWDFYEIARELSDTYRVTFLLLDEVHFQPDYEMKLKKIYDSLSLRVIFTSSVALSLVASAHDLSRRVRLRTLYTFAFREYVHFKTGNLLPRLTLSDLLETRWTAEHMRTEHLFGEYLTGGVLPFSLDEADPLPLLANVVEKIIASDVPRVMRLPVEELAHIRRLVTFVGKAPADGISYSSISRNVAITRYKAESYCDVLEKAFVLQVLLPEGANVLKEPKILMWLPVRLLYRSAEECIGALREDFFVQAMRMAGHSTRYLKSTKGAKTPDYVCTGDDGEIVIEVGGRSKGVSQFKGTTLRKQLILTHSDRIAGLRRPLFLAGFL